MLKKNYLSLLVLFAFFVSVNPAGAQLPVTNGLELWLDATDTKTLFQDLNMRDLALDGDEIALWADKSGNGYHATQADSFVRPEREDGGMSGMPTVRFDGVDGDGMAIDDDLALFRPYTVFIANQYWGDTRGRTLQSQDINWLHGLWSGTFGHFAEGWVGNRAAEAEPTPYVMDAVGDLSSSSLYVNGRDFTNNSAPVGEPGRLGIGSVGMFGGEVSDADVSEIVIYDRVLTADELTQTRNYFYLKYQTKEIGVSPMDEVFAGELGTFTGGDEGEGLDFDGDFLYAINVGGLGGSVVGDAEFTDGSEFGLEDETPGVFITDANELPEWHLAADYGDTANDDELEFVMNSIRWNTPPGLDVEMEVEEGTRYKLQMMFAESCCNRGFDIFLEDEQVVDNVNIGRVQEGINNGSQGVVYSHTFVAEDDTLNILLGGSDPESPDNNPILSAITLELAAGLPGDFDNDGMLTANDIDLLSLEVTNGGMGAEFDLNEDGEVNNLDRIVWVEDLKNTYFGDADLDGEFGSTDFVRVFQAGKYEDDVEDNASWAEGDWNGDQDFDSSDFVSAFQGGGFEVGPRPATAAVPEPSAALLVLMAIGLLATGRRRQR